MGTYLRLFAAAGLLLLTGQRATAQQADQAARYPSRPVHIVVCLPPGGGGDIVTRVVADGLQRQLGQPIVVENKGGQAGNIGAEAVWSAEPDGYTLLASQPAPLTTNALLYRNLAFDPARFVPVAVMTSITNTLTVRADFPAADVAAFIAHAKTHPGKVSYASQSSGTTSHLTAVMFEQATGARLLHVPYRGTTPAINDLIGGHVDAFFNELASSVEMLKAGKVRILAVTAPARDPELPDVPTMQEAGLAGFASNTWNALSAPPGTPAPIIARLNAAVNAVLKTPEVQKRLRAMHLQIMGGTPEQMAALIKADMERWGAVIHAARLTVD